MTARIDATLMPEYKAKEAESAPLLGEPRHVPTSNTPSISPRGFVRDREMALTRIQLAELLLEHYLEEREAAIQHLDFAIREFCEMRLQPSLERAVCHRGLLKA